MFADRAARRLESLPWHKKEFEEFEREEGCGNWEPDPARDIFYSLYVHEQIYNPVILSECVGNFQFASCLFQEIQWTIKLFISAGIYQQMNIEQSPISVPDFKKKAESDRYKPPDGSLEFLEQR